VVSKDTTKLILIFICIALHCLSGAGIFHSHPLSAKLMTFNGGDIDFLAIRNKLSFLMRIAGGYALGYLADKLGFFKTMKIICLITITTSLILFFFKSSDIFENAILICLAHGLLTFMRWSSLILPFIYISRRCEKSNCCKYSTLALCAFIFGMLIDNMFSIVYKNTAPFDVFFIYVTSGLLGFVIYSYLDTVPKVKLKKTQENPISKEKISLAFLLAGVCGACFSYEFYFVENYFNTVMIVETAGRNIVYSPFWLTLFLTLFPIAKKTKNLNFVKILQLSLCGILLSVGLFYIVPVYSKPVLFIHQVIYAVSFGIFLPSALNFIYHLLQGSHSYFRMNFIFGAGVSTLIIISNLLAKAKLLPAPFLGLILITTLLTSCIGLVSYFKFSKENSACKCCW
jgi:MFS family permease